VAYITLSSFRVNPNFQDFFSATPGYSVKLFTCSVSMEAHYRDPSFLHNPFFDLFFPFAHFSALPGGSCAIRAIFRRIRRGDWL
ncbi:hypothetical protein, partial [Serratia marcescens]|uniref:hypothetical protein n=1 Tax=Serratia marcescens TaxID=615 RepID=UPI002B05BB89